MREALNVRFRLAAKAPPEQDAKKRGEAWSGPDYLASVVPPVLNALVDADARVRYYACEALYNIAKVLPCLPSLRLHLRKIWLRSHGVGAASPVIALMQTCMGRGAQALGGSRQPPALVSTSGAVLCIRAHVNTALLLASLRPGLPESAAHISPNFCLRAGGPGRLPGAALHGNV